MFHRATGFTRRRRISAAVLALALILTMALPSAAAPAAPDALPTIDHFDLTQTVTQTGVGFTSPPSVAGPNVNILGGYRKVVAEVTSGGGSLTDDANISFSSQFSHSQGSGVSGRTTITYDGTNGSTLSPTGLGAQDLTRGGQDNAIFVDVTSDDWAVPMTIRLYTTANQCSSLTLQLPGSLPVSAYPTVFAFRYYDFLQDAAAGCTGGPVTFTNIGAIVLVVDGTLVPDADVTFGLLETGSLDYGDAPNSYRTNYNANTTQTGPAHVITTLRMGNLIDGEIGNAVASPGANTDDTISSADEDGVVRPAASQWRVGTVTGGNGGSVQVTVNGNGCLMGWIDWAGTGSFTADPNMLILNNVSVVAGTATYTFDIPASSNGTGVTLSRAAGFYARFRLYPRDANGITCISTKSVGGAAYGGEVEDYLWHFNPNAVALSSMSASSAASPLALPLGIVTVLGVLLGGMVLVRRRA
jgi:hypothetical protein